MAQFRISGVWRNPDNIITHYALHEAGENYIAEMKKISRADLIKLLSVPSNEAKTWLWNYTTWFWMDGAKVVVSGQDIRTVHDNEIVDELAICSTTDGCDKNKRFTVSVK